MSSKAILILAVALCAMLVSTADSAIITWSAPSTSPARDFAGNPLPGQYDAAAIDLSLGALVQLWKAVGAIDDPRANPAAYADTAWIGDDVLLQESHVNYGTFAPANSGSWTNSNVNFNGIDFPAVNQGDILYVRAYNLPESDWMAAGSSKELGIANSQGEIVSQLVGRTDIPQGYAFPDLKTQPIPEPATLLLLAPGLALWAIRRKK